MTMYDTDTANPTAQTRDRLLARIAQARGTALALNAALSRACDAAMSGQWREADSMLRTARLLAPYLEVVVGRSWRATDVFWGAADVFETAADLRQKEETT